MTTTTAPRARLSPADMAIFLATVEPFVCRFAGKLSRHYQIDADDLVQDVRAILVVEAANYDPALSSPSHWSGWHVRSALRDRLRADGRERDARRVYRRDRKRFRESDSLRSVLDSELTEAVGDVVGSLPAKQVAIVRRHYGLDGRPPASVRQIAAEMGMSLRTCQREFELAKAALRDRLSACAS